MLHLYFVIFSTTKGIKEHGLSLEIRGMEINNIQKKTKIKKNKIKLTTTNNQNPKNIKSTTNVINGCKNNPGTAPKHFAVSLKSSASTSTRLHIANINNNKMIWK